jgi:hypothetical protein
LGRKVSGIGLEMGWSGEGKVIGGQRGVVWGLRVWEGLFGYSIRKGPGRGDNWELWLNLRGMLVIGWRYDEGIEKSWIELGIIAQIIVLRGPGYKWDGSEHLY